eukprot:NODE_357_length_8846_cov_0.279410.p2 type:complete len:200 gc:universal NODE_357_length_8846_cov_0.279410:7554-6955(-)
MGLQRQQFINTTNNLPLPPIEFLPISPNPPATMTESTEEMDRELGLNYIHTLFGGNLVLILGMMISNIDEIDRIENAVNLSTETAFSQITVQEAIQCSVFGEYSGEFNDVNNESFYTPEIEGALEDVNGHDESKYINLIESGTVFLAKINSFDQPIYSNMVPTINNYISDLKSKIEQAFPSVTTQSVQSNIYDFMHYLQ